MTNHDPNGSPAYSAFETTWRFPLKIGLFAVLGLAQGGCATVVYEAQFVERVVAMNRAAPPASYEVVGRFDLDRRAIFLVGDAVTVRQARLDEEVLEALARTGGDAIINLTVREENDAIDLLVRWVQAGLNTGQLVALDAPPAGGLLFLGGGSLVGTRSVRITGDIIRWLDSDPGEPGKE